MVVNNPYRIRTETRWRFRGHDIHDTPIWERVQATPRQIRANPQWLRHNPENYRIPNSIRNIAERQRRQRRRQQIERARPVNNYRQRDIRNYIRPVRNNNDQDEFAGLSDEAITRHFEFDDDNLDNAIANHRIQYPIRAAGPRPHNPYRTRNIPINNEIIVPEIEDRVVDEQPDDVDREFNRIMRITNRGTNHWAWYARNYRIQPHRRARYRGRYTR